MCVCVQKDRCSPPRVHYAATYVCAVISGQWRQKDDVSWPTLYPKQNAISNAWSLNFFLRLSLFRLRLCVSFILYRHAKPVLIFNRR